MSSRPACHSQFYRVCHNRDMVTSPTASYPPSQPARPAGSLPRPQDVAALAQEVRRAVGSVVVGAREAVDTAVAVLLAGGHLLIEDVPGLGKTTLATALARSLDLSTARIQMTSDLLPADVTGVSVYDQSAGAFRFHRGPVFAHVVVADELNRATARTQSALLEAMGEGHVSVDGRRLALPDPFLVVATQNPYDAAGTFPLPHAQLDRFTACVSMGYPAPAQEASMLLARGGEDPLDRLTTVAGAADVRVVRAVTARTFADPAVAEYVVALLAATRAHPALALGASPRAGLALLALARARAVMDGRGFVTPDDVARSAPAVLPHRLRVARPGGVPGEDDADVAAQVVADVVATTPVPSAGASRAGRPAAGA